MIGLTIPVTCAQCGAPVEVINEGRVLAGTTATAIVGCVQCATEFEVTVTLRQHGPNRNHAAKRAATTT